MSFNVRLHVFRCPASGLSMSDFMSFDVRLHVFQRPASIQTPSVLFDAAKVRQVCEPTSVFMLKSH